MHIEVNELSPALRDALKAHGYGRKDIKVEASAAVDTTIAGGDGLRGFVTIVNLDTGARESKSGSWGGANIFTDNGVDRGGILRIPSNAAVIKGTRGHGPVWAHIIAHPDAFGRMLPSGEEEALSKEEQDAIYCFAALKGGPYRTEELRQRNVSDATIDSLVERGYLKRNKNGATQITTKGKNAR